VVARIFSLVGLLAVVAATLYPLRFETRRDSFPISNYPMFARARPNAEVHLHYFVAVTPANERLYVAPTFVGNVEVLQARALIHGAASRGPAESQKLCSDVAARLSTEREYAGARLSLVAGRHDAIAFFIEGTLGKERTVTACQIPGQGQ
jgi:hypothetical protein